MNLSSPLILGIETSCDETGIGLVRVQAPQAPGGLPTGQVLAEALHSQIALHADYGGVVPELASRDHVSRILPLTRQVLSEAAVTPQEIDVIAYTQGPGLAGALLVGASVAEGLASALSKPLLGVHHLEGHLLSPLIEGQGGVADEPPFPFLALLVSGGHTQIMRVDAIGRYALLGETIDDAAGEAFDKSAQLLGLGYPGGPAISQAALSGNPKRFDLPRPLLKRPTLDFSFAGLKTAVLTQTQKLSANTDASVKSGSPFSEQDTADMAASVQAAIVEVLAAKCERAMMETGIRKLVVAGGVGANRELRARLQMLSNRLGAQISFPPPRLCTDNGVMIAWAAGLKILAGEPTRSAGSFSVAPRWPLASEA